MLLSGAERRRLLARARLMLVFTPELCASEGDDPLRILERALRPDGGVDGANGPVDVVQVRPKPLPGAGDGHTGMHTGVQTGARATFEWTRRVLELRGDRELLVLVNDRVDVARALQGEGCDGVHLGQDDAPPAGARALLGEGALIGLSTPDPRQVVLAGEEPVDYLGVGPVFATATKGYARGLGPERAWIADSATHLPVFPIGGIDLANAGELDRIGRAAVSSSVLKAEDPAAAARQLRAMLTE